MDTPISPHITVRQGKVTSWIGFQTPAAVAAAHRNSGVRTRLNQYENRGGSTEYRPAIGRLVRNRSRTELRAQFASGGPPGIMIVPRRSEYAWRFAVKFAFRYSPK
jgi:hypothetical protein